LFSLEIFGRLHFGELALDYFTFISQNDLKLDS